MGSLHWFPMYEGNDFEWGLPLALRSEWANIFDGKILVFPVREGGSMDLEVCLIPRPCLGLRSKWHLCWALAASHELFLLPTNDLSTNID